MQVRLTTTISTIIEVTSGASFEEAKAEIFGNYADRIAEEDGTEDIQSAQTACISFDTPIASEITHSFTEVK